MSTRWTHCNLLLILVQDITVSLLLLVGFVASGIVECVFAAELESRDEIWWKETAAAAVSYLHLCSYSCSPWHT